MTMPGVPTPSEAEAVIEKFMHDFNDFSGVPEKFRHSVEEGLHLIPIPWIKHKAQELWNHLKEVLSKLLDILKDIAKAIDAPFVLIKRGFDWLDIKGKISQVSANTDPNNLQAGRVENWKGDGGAAYRNAASNQSTTAGKVSDIAETTALTLFSAGGAGITFYAAVGYVIVDTVYELMAEAEGAASGIGTLPAIVAALVTALKSTACITALVGGIIGLISGEVIAFATIKAKLDDNSKFPHGNWPDPGAHAY